MEEGKTLAETAVESADEVKSIARDYYQEARGQVEDLDSRIRDVVAERPLACIAGAFAVGFLLARATRIWR